LEQLKTIIEDHKRCHDLSNPFDNEITIKVNAVKDQIVSIQLYSLTGQIVLDKKTKCCSGENVLKNQGCIGHTYFKLKSMEKDCKQSDEN
jgi:hypothetical protein